MQSPAAAGGAGKEGNMRIDKFLKVSRLIKRRTVAKPRWPTQAALL